MYASLNLTYGILPYMDKAANIFTCIGMEWLTEPSLVYAKNVITLEIFIWSEPKLQKYQNPFYKNLVAVFMNNFSQEHLFHKFIFKKISWKFSF